MSGLVSAIHRASLHDGPGLRSTVFLMGCPLRCRWCHNPETWRARPTLRLRADACLGCGACAAACPRHRLEADGHHLVRDGCTGCGACATACPSGALEVVGVRRTVAEVLAVVRRDAAAYRASGGGLTLSGGEPLAQPAFAAALLAAAHAEGIATCVETCGQADPAALAALLPHTDRWLWDCKAVDDGRHHALTGVGSALIHANLDRALAAGAVVRLRCPLVPGCNDSDADLDRLAEFALARPLLEGVELMPYHRLGAAKAAECGVAVLDLPSATVADAARWRAHLAQRGLAVRG